MKNEDKSLPVENDTPEIEKCPTCGLPLDEAPRGWVQSRLSLQAAEKNTNEHVIVLLKSNVCLRGSTIDSVGKSTISAC